MMLETEGRKMSYKVTIWIVVVGFPLHLFFGTMIVPGQADTILNCLLLGLAACNFWYMAKNPAVFRVEDEFRNITKTGRNAIVLPGVFRFVEMVTRSNLPAEDLRWMPYVDALLCFLGAIYLWRKIWLVNRRNTPKP
ncbi:MAG: hypothetical protein WCK51_06735 [Armatimonadota bacterium]